MALAPGKFVPTAVMLTAVGYCCWPYLDLSSHHAPQEEAQAETKISTAMLSPDLKPPSDRDPFGIPEVKPVDTKTDPPGPVNTVANNPESQPEMEATEAEANSVASAPSEGAGPVSLQADVPPEEALKGLTLNATLLRGPNRVAIINSRLFKEGETVPQTDAKTLPFKVTKILRHKVVLNQQGRSLDLNYPDPNVKAPVATKKDDLEGLPPLLKLLVPGAGDIDPATGVPKSPASDIPPEDLLKLLKTAAPLLNDA